MEDDVVVLLVLASVRERVSDDRPHAIESAEIAEVVVVDVQVAEQDDVVFAARSAADRLIHLRERVALRASASLPGSRVHIDENEGKRLLRRRAADAEHRHERFAFEQISGSFTVNTLRRLTSIAAVSYRNAYCSVLSERPSRGPTTLSYTRPFMLTYVRRKLSMK